jgi:hypothetical protein
MTTQITDMLVTAYIQAIEAYYAALPEDERPKIVKEGRLQDDPTKPVFSVMVSPNDYADDEKWADIPVSRGDEALDRYQFKVYAYEVGGGEMWWRRGIIEWQIFGIKPKYKAEEIINRASLTKGRLERVVMTLALNNMTDDFKEVAKVSLPVLSNMFRSGGEKSQALIWRGKVRYQVLTERPVQSSTPV